MFNTYHSHQHHTDYVTKEVTKNVNVTEKRAPTDESVKLLNEFKLKAETEIIKSIVINDNLVNGCVVAINNSPSLFNIRIHYKFNLNGKDILGFFDLERNITDDMLSDKMIRVLYESLSKEITLSLLKENSEFIKNNILR